MGVEIALALPDERDLARLAAGPLPTVRQHFFVLGQPIPPGSDDFAARPVDRLYFGSEFCEHLVPAPGALKRCLRLAREWRLAVSLVTPLASDGCIRQLRRLLPLLPKGSEVIANDWGVANVVRRDHPALKIVAGRLLCKMVKDPRLPTATWANLYPHGLASAAFAGVLARLGIGQMEMDVPPFATPEAFAGLPLPVAVHAPFGYVAKGRLCKIGSLRLTPRRKFAPGHACRRECLDYCAIGRREGAAATELATVQRGNTVLYRHSEAMGQALSEAMARRWIGRVVLSGG